jgi:oxygen-independent coproporphyrinogen-3 oxidase
MMNGIGLYLHFPFCVRKCRYCDFLSSPPDEETKGRYAAALIREIRAYGGALRDREVDSVFLGGGTPSVMPVPHLRRIFEVLRETFRIAPGAEITMEVNPGTVTEPLMELIREEVSRVSLGVQSFDDRELAFLGRIHTASEADRSVERLRMAGVNNLNLDLMSGLPDQTEESWEKTLIHALSLRPEHISAYSLIVEEGTPFAAMRKEGRLPLPDEGTERRMYARTGEILAAAGFRRYEISNYAREGFACRHNIRYWRRGEYLGLGLGAASLMDETRWRNTRSLKTYLDGSASPEAILRDVERLDRKSEIEEFMFLGLRMTDGITEEAFRHAFALSLADVYGDVIRKLEREGLMTGDGRGRFRLTDYGIDISNEVLAEFLLD